MKGQRKKLSTETLPDFEVLEATVTKKGIATSGQAIPPYPDIGDIAGPVQVRWNFEVVTEEENEGFQYDFVNAKSISEEDLQEVGVPQAIISQIIYI